MGTAHLLDALRDLDDVCVAVVVTTDKVYRNNEWPYPYREDDALGGHDPYSASKAAAELVAASYRSAFLEAQQVAVATARAGNVIGGGDWSEDRLIPDAVRAWQSGSVLDDPAAAGDSPLAARARPARRLPAPGRAALARAEPRRRVQLRAAHRRGGDRRHGRRPGARCVWLGRVARRAGRSGPARGGTARARSRAGTRGARRGAALGAAGGCAANDALVPASRRRRFGADAVRSRHRRSRSGRRWPLLPPITPPRSQDARREPIRGRRHEARRPEARAPVASRR